jgi:hypothetical protein
MYFIPKPLKESRIEINEYKGKAKTTRHPIIVPNTVIDTGDRSQRK